MSFLYEGVMYYDWCPNCSAHGFTSVMGDSDVSCTNCGRIYNHISRKPTAMMTEQMDMVSPMFARLDAVTHVGAKQVSVRWLVEQYGWQARELEHVTQHLATAKRNEKILEEMLHEEQAKSEAQASEIRTLLCSSKQHRNDVSRIAKQMAKLEFEWTGDNE